MLCKLVCISFLLLSCAGICQSADKIGIASSDRLLQTQNVIRTRLETIKQLNQLLNMTPPIGNGSLKEIIKNNREHLRQLTYNTTTYIDNESQTCNAFRTTISKLQAEFQKALDEGVTNPNSVPNQARLKSLIYLIVSTEALVEQGEEGGVSLLSEAKSTCVASQTRENWLKNARELMDLDQTLSKNSLGMPDVAHTTSLSLSLSWMIADQADSAYRWAIPRIAAETAIGLVVWELVVVRATAELVEMGMISSRVASIGKAGIVGTFGAYQGASLGKAWSERHLKNLTSEQVSQFLNVANKYASAHASDLQTTFQILESYEQAEATHRANELMGLRDSLAIIRQRWKTLENARLQNQAELAQIHSELERRRIAQ